MATITIDTCEKTSNYVALKVVQEWISLNGSHGYKPSRFIHWSNKQYVVIESQRNDHLTSRNADFYVTLVEEEEE